jgi:hypothetical protein
MKDAKPASLQDRIELFLRSNRVILAILTFLVIAAIISVVVGISLGRSAREREAERLYELETAYAEWQSAFEEDAPEAAGILALISEYDFRNGGYGYFRQNFILGSVYEQIGEYQSAADQYAVVSDARGYLGTISLLKQGLMLEAAGDLEGARSTLVRLVDEYDTAEEPRVLFTLGRLSEAIADYEGARTWYERVVSDFASSGWSNFAQNRLISLRVDGHIGD